MEEEILIDMVKQNRFLYDFRSRDYKDLQRRQAAWENIGKALNMTVEQSRNTWTKLRNCYTNALKRRTHVQQTGNVTKKLPKWRYESEMSFLLPYVLDSKRDRVDPAASEEEADMPFECTDIFNPLTRDSSEEKSTPIDMVTIKPDLQSQISRPNIILEHPHSSTSYQPYQDRKLNTPKLATNRQNYDTTIEDLVEIMKMNNELRSKSIQFNSATDEIEMFFLSLSRTVKKLPKEQQIRIKMSVSQLVYEAELSHYSGDSQPVQRERIIEPMNYTNRLSSCSTPSPSSAFPRLIVNKIENFDDTDEIHEVKVKERKRKSLKK